MQTRPRAPGEEVETGFRPAGALPRRSRASSDADLSPDALTATSFDMAREPLPKWLVRRGGRIHYVRRVPGRYARLDRRVYVTASCETDDVGKALIARDRINAATVAYWRALAQGDDPDAKARYRAAINYARLAGYAYEPFDILRDAGVDSLLDRIASLEAALEEQADRAPKRYGLLPVFRTPG
ncbi:hypothetical protein [Aurantimonas sp. VKM B-3413]|uniref:hypothetical protein n=1 Tax=Aurantimonas sp. VKM B-3413 TaxID=2779401 RepID=UPI001E2C7008|nr:hypothetical protein [Aurantimonas sp. VKM B-3413]MCB8840256.1 hypothetical protein [Aurantimonas sp. VKM B-3413]